MRLLTIFPALLLGIPDVAVEPMVQPGIPFAQAKNEDASAKVIAAELTNHGTINTNLGLPNDQPTQQLSEFINDSMSNSGPDSSEQVDKLKKLGARITFDEQKRIIGVNLGERKVTDADLVNLTALQNLQELDLTRTRITSAGLVMLKDLTGLKKLFLTETKVDDTGIAHLKRLKKLRLIGLSGTKISDAALDHLRELTELKQLFCLATGVTDTGAEKLRRTLPECQVTR